MTGRIRYAIARAVGRYDQQVGHPQWVLVDLDGVRVKATLLDGVSPFAGGAVTLVQDGRRLVCITAIPVEPPPPDFDPGTCLPVDTIVDIPAGIVGMTTGTPTAGYHYLALNYVTRDTASSSNGKFGAIYDIEGANGDWWSECGLSPPTMAHQGINLGGGVYRYYNQHIGIFELLRRGDLDNACSNITTISGLRVTGFESQLVWAQACRFTTRAPLTTISTPSAFYGGQALPMYWGPSNSDSWSDAYALTFNYPAERTYSMEGWAAPTKIVGAVNWATIGESPPSATTRNMCGYRWYMAGRPSHDSTPPAGAPVGAAVSTYIEADSATNSVASATTKILLSTPNHTYS